jgi:RimJ/RimL family protein N-acetyltransferase
MRVTAIEIRPVRGEDAGPLFPMIHGSPVTDTIQWDGPASLAEYEKGLAEREGQHARGEIHMFTIVEKTTGELVGSIDIRPETDFWATIGLWVGERFHGRGYGTEAVREIARYGFEILKLAKIEGAIFVGNESSRRIFEKNGFALEGTLRYQARKRGRLRDVWIMGKTVEEHSK